MTPTRWTTLAGLGLLLGLLGWALPEWAYGDLIALPSGAAVTAAVIAAFELGLARVVSRKVRGVAGGRPMHPLQVARALVLAKASSTAGAMLLGFYAGFLVWVVQHDELRAARHDTRVATGSVVACVCLVVAALLLERACRTPSRRDEMQP